MKLAYLIFLFWMTIIICGCTGEENKHETQVNPFADVSLNVAVPQGVMSLDDWKTLSQEWETRTQVKVKFEELPNPNPQDQESSLSYIKQVRDINPQLIIFPWQLKGLLNAEHLLSALPQSAQEENELDWSNYFSGLKKNICQIDEQPGVIPLSIPTYKLFYRKDLLERSQKSVPQSWDELIKLGKELPQFAEGKPIFLPLAESSSMDMFLSVILPYVTTDNSLSLYYDFSTGNSNCEHPGFARGFRKVEELIQVIDATSTQMSPQDCLQKLLKGEALMVISNEAYLPVKSGDANTEEVIRSVEVKLGIAPLPGVEEQYDAFKKEWVGLSGSIVHRATMIGNQGYVAGVTMLTPESEELQNKTKLAASNLLRELINTGMVDSGGRTILTPTRIADLSSNVAKFSDELSFQEQTDILETIQLQLQEKLCFSPALLPDDKFEVLWRSLAKKAFTGGHAEDLSQELVLKNAELVKGITAEKVRDYYRAQLGLKQIKAETGSYVPDLPSSAKKSLNGE